MSTGELFFYIIAGISLQVAVISALAFIRHLRSYQYLKKRLAGFEGEPEKVPVLGLLTTSEKNGDAGPWQGYREFRVAQKVFEDKAKSICSFYLSPMDTSPLASFKPGQFLTFNPVVGASGEAGKKKIVRCYSLSDRPGLDHYRISIKRVPPPANKPEVRPGLSSNHFHDNVKAGDILAVKPPSGHFFLQGGTDPVVLIGGGIGITPMLSMLNHTLNAPDSSREIWLFYGVRNSADHAMKEHLEDLAEKHSNFHMHVCYSAPLERDRPGRDYQHKGHVDVRLLRLTLSFKLYEFYICGPRPMMEAIIPALEDWGVPDQHIHYESFGPASVSRPVRDVKARSEEEAFNVEFNRSGKSFTWDGQADSLLEFAETCGIEVDSGCRGGGCGTCQVTINSGEVTYIQAPDFEPTPGSCLLCVTRPKSDLSVEA